MEKLIACCGLNCATCEARTATIKNDDSLRKITAEKWKVMFSAPSMTPDMVNCTGCREAGVKFSHCEECEIRNCVSMKGYETCAECADLEKCPIVGSIHKFVPEALANLKNLN